MRAELDRFDQEHAAACDRAQMVLPWPEGVNLRRGEFFHLLAQLENLDGKRFHHVGPRRGMSLSGGPEGRPDLGPPALWVPGNRIVYLGHVDRRAEGDVPAGVLGDGVVRRWRLDAYAPACAWRPGDGAPADTTLYLEIEPGRQAMPGELVVDAGEGWPRTFTTYAAHSLLIYALVRDMEIRAESDELRGELARLLGEVAGESLDLFAEEDRDKGRELLERAAAAVETSGHYRLTGDNDA